MKVKSNILLVTSEFPPLPGGIGNHALNVAKGLHDNNNKVTVLADQRINDGSEQIFDSKLEFEVRRIALRRLRVFMYFDRIFTYIKLLKSHDVVIASGKFPLILVAAFSLIRKKKYVAVIHGTEVNFSNKLLKSVINWSLKRFQKVIAVSHYTKSLVSSLELKNCKVITNGFNTSIFDNSREKFLNLKGNPKLITVGNVTERKGQLNVIKLLPDIILKYPDIHFHCVGLPTRKKEFLDEAKRLNVHKHVTFHGRVEQDMLKNYLKQCDIFVMLSSKTKTGDVEGFGIAILEAHSLGLPAIGALNCGIEDAIDSNNSGILIDHDSSKQFEMAITNILARRDHYKMNAKLWAQKHGWNVVLEKYKKYVLT